MNKKLMRTMGFGDAVKLVEQKKCPFCKKKIKQEDFRDILSKKEYKISGLCQLCQDNTFNNAREVL